MEGIAASWLRSRERFPRRPERPEAGRTPVAGRQSAREPGTAAVSINSQGVSRTE